MTAAAHEADPPPPSRNGVPQVHWQSLFPLALFRCLFGCRVFFGFLANSMAALWSGGWVFNNSCLVAWVNPQNPPSVGWGGDIPISGLMGRRG